MADRNDRVMVFIDGSNLYHSVKATFQRTDIDMGKLAEKLLERRRLIRVYYYNARVGRREEPERYKRQETFFNGVAQTPYFELKLGRLVYQGWPSSPPYEKGVDIMLATDLLTHSFKNNYDIGILVAGDADYVGALQAVKDNGKNIEVALFGKESTSRALREVADRVHTMDGRFLRGCWKQAAPPPRRPSQQAQTPPAAQPASGGPIRTDHIAQAEPEDYPEEEQFPLPEQWPSGHWGEPEETAPPIATPEVPQPAQQQPPQQPKSGRRRRRPHRGSGQGQPQSGANSQPAFGGLPSPEQWPSGHWGEPEESQPSQSGSGPAQPKSGRRRRRPRHIPSSGTTLLPDHPTQ